MEKQSSRIFYCYTFFSVQDKHTRPSLVIQQHFLLIFCNSAMLYRTDRDLSGPFVPSQQVYHLSCNLPSKQENDLTVSGIIAESV